MTTHPISLQQTNAPPKTEERRGAASPPLAGMLWFAGWLFTIGFAKLVWWQILVGLIAWPYFLGVVLR